MYTPFAFGLGRLASAPLSKVSPLIIIKEKKYPAQTSPASVEGRLRPPAKFALVPGQLPRPRQRGGYGRQRGLSWYPASFPGVSDALTFFSPPFLVSRQEKE